MPSSAAGWKKRPVASLTEAAKVVALPSECTAGWLPRMRSSSVVPVRGMPTMKTGRGPSPPPGVGLGSGVRMIASSHAASRAAS